MKRFLTAAVLALAPLPALAQPGTPPIEAPTPAPQAATPAPAPRATERQIADARREADKVIREARAQNLFTNVTDGAVGKARHNRSGLVCSFSVGDRTNKITIFEQGIGIPTGDDVGCSTSFDGDTVETLYATRYRPAKAAKDALTEAALAIKARFSSARWYEGEVPDASTDRAGKAPLPQTWMAHYIVDWGDGEHYTAARVAEHNGWIFKQRLTVPMSNLQAGQLLGSINWLMVLVGVVDGGNTI